MSSCLLVIDVQNDFVIGSLEVKKAEEIIEGINAVSSYFDHIVFTEDWHPRNHVSFYETHKDDPSAVLFKEYTLPGGKKQILWPVHCVANSEGAKLHKDLEIPIDSIVFTKGSNPQIDSYSAFFDENGNESKLNAILHSKGVETVTIVGLALDYCVKFTALHSAQLGFHTTVAKDLTRLVYKNKEAEVQAELELGGVHITNDYVETILTPDRDGRE
jgi:nicotinamidase/pyrazinamidase